MSAAASFLGELKPPAGPGRVFVAAIAGTPEPVAVALDDGGVPVLAPSCSSSITEASPAVRLAELLSLLPGRSQFVSICSDDLAAHIADIGESLARLRTPPRCLTGDPTDQSQSPGLQADCVVREHVGASTTELPQCVGVVGPRPCYRLAPDDRCTETSAGLALVVVREPQPRRDGLLEIECR